MSGYKVGDKAILHKNRIKETDTCGSLTVASALEVFKDLQENSIEILIGSFDVDRDILPKNLGYLSISPSWVTKVEEPNPPTDALVDLEDSYIANQPEHEFKGFGVVEDPALSEGSEVSELIKYMRETMEASALMGTGAYHVWGDKEGNISTEKVNPWDKVAVHEVDPNKEMIEADHGEDSAFDELLSVCEPMPEDLKRKIDDLVGDEVPDLEQPLTPIDAIEKVGRALTVTQTVHNHRLGLINYFDKEYLD